MEAQMGKELELNLRIKPSHSLNHENSVPLTELKIII